MAHNMIRKVLSISLAVLLMFCCVSPVASLATEEDPLQQYINEWMTYYLLAQDLDIENNVYHLSQGIPILNGDDSDKRAYFLFSGDACIGELIVTKIEDRFVSSFSYGEISEVSVAYRSNTPVCLYVNKQATYLCTPNQLIHLYGLENASAATLSEGMGTQDLPLECLTLSPLSLQLPLATQRSSSNFDELILDVPIVPNDTSPATGDGLCWAASIASIGSYKTNVTPYTALQIYNLVRSHYGTEPTGTKKYILGGFDILGLNYEYSPGGLEFSDVKLFIQRNSPIYASIRDANGNNAHGVVICGYSAYNGATLVRLMDPNKDFITYGSFYSDETTFTYAVSGTTYTDWYRRFNEPLYYDS